MPTIGRDASRPTSTNISGTLSQSKIVKQSFFHAEGQPCWTILFHAFWLRTAGRLNAVCNTACSGDKASDGKLRSTFYVCATQVPRYTGRDETCERAILQVDTVPSVAGDCRSKKTC